MFSMRQRRRKPPTRTSRHFDRRLGMSDARIYPFKGMAACFPDPPEDHLKDTERPSKR
jgi:hypothetical protein